jgi:predicted aspartyl protease
MKWVALAVALLAACHLSPQVAWAADNRNELSFKLYRGYAIVVHGSIGSIKNLNFLIDTGAVPSVLDRRVAERLHLGGTTEKLSVFTQELKAERVSAQNVDLGPFHADTLPAVVRDLSFAEEALGTKVDAIIGFDLLNRSAFTIDYQSKKITVGPIAPSLVVIPYHAGPSYAVVEMKLQQKTILLLVDTGASNLVLFESATRDCADAIIHIGSRTWSNMGGQVEVKEVQLKDAYLGTMPWGSQDAFILASASGYMPGGLSGLLGVTSLKARRIGFDPDRMLLVLEPSEHASTIAENPGH